MEPGRDAWQKPDELVRAVKLKDGQVACDVGAGPGYFALRLGRAVGSAGLVYAVDVEPRILDALRDGPLTVNELTVALGGTQQNVSKHVGVLAQAGVVDRERAGNHVRCSIADPSVFELCEIVCGGLRRKVSELEELLA